MQESTYTRSVNKKLPSEIYAWKVSDAFTGGVPDCWYSSGEGRDMWIEWKYYPKLPKVINLVKNKTPKMSKLQQDWCNDRYDEGRDVAVMIGCPQGVVILQHKAWMHDVLNPQIWTKQQAADWIADHLRTPPMMNNMFFRYLSRFKYIDGCDYGGHFADNHVCLPDPMLAIEYLSERYPPSLLPEGARERACARLFLRQIFTAYERGEILSDLTPPSEGFITGGEITIFDIALLPLTQQPEWEGYRDKVIESIQCPY
jgi:hypothetical protein